MKNKWYKSKGGWIGAVGLIGIGILLSSTLPTETYAKGLLNLFGLVNSEGFATISMSNFFILFFIIHFILGFLLGYFIQKKFFKRKKR